MSARASAAIVPSRDNDLAPPLCGGCRCIAAALAEVGMDPGRVICGKAAPSRRKFVCTVGYGYGTEGLPLDEVERLCDKAVDICCRVITSKEEA